MSAIKNVGVSAVEEIKAGRERIGRNFKSIYDFCSNTDTRVVNKRAVESLVLAGAFDSCKGTRAQNFASIEEALSFGSKVQNSKNSQNDSLFGDSKEDFQIEEPELPSSRPWEQKETLAKERSVLGFYLSDHPLRKYEIEYRSLASVHLGETETYNFNEQVRACGVVTEVRTKIDKRGNQMVFFKLDDFSGSCECLMFSKVYALCENLIVPESTILVAGKLESSGDAVKLHVDEAFSMDDVRLKLIKRLGIILDSSLHQPDSVAEIKNLMENNVGTMPVSVCLKDDGNTREFHLDYKVALNQDFVQKLITLLGEDSIVYFAN